MSSAATTHLLQNQTCLLAELISRGNCDGIVAFVGLSAFDLPKPSLSLPLFQNPPFPVTTSPPVGCAALSPHPGYIRFDVFRDYNSRCSGDNELD